MLRQIPYNYHHLYYFMVIAEEGSLSTASKKLLVGQPALSAQLSQFEKALGFLLFDRIGRRLVLTERGRLALQYAQGVFALGNELFEVMNSRKQPDRVYLRIGALDSVPKQVIQKLAEMALSLGKVKISLLEGNSTELLTELRQHKLDLLMTNFGPTAKRDEGLFFRKVSSADVSLYGAPKFKSLRSKYPASISNQPFILPTHESLIRQNFEEWMGLRGYSIDAILETQDIALKKLMAIRGMGLVPMAKHAVALQVRRGDLIKIGDLEGLHEELFLVSAGKRFANHFAAELFKKFHL